MKDYHINVFYSQEDKCYVADIPDLRYCSAFGKTAEEALHEVMIAKSSGWKPLRPAATQPPYREVSRGFARTTDSTDHQSAKDQGYEARASPKIGSESVGQAVPDALFPPARECKERGRRPKDRSASNRRRYGLSTFLGNYWRLGSCIRIDDVFCRIMLQASPRQNAR